MVNLPPEFLESLNERERKRAIQLSALETLELEQLWRKVKRHPPGQTILTPAGHVVISDILFAER